MNIAFLAHDKRKELMIQFCTAYKSILSKHSLFATATTGRLVAEATGLPVHLVGVGEQVEDLRAFSAAEYARGLVGDAGAIREPPAEG